MQIMVFPFKVCILKRVNSCKNNVMLYKKMNYHNITIHQKTILMTLLQSSYIYCFWTTKLFLQHWDFQSHVHKYPDKVQPLLNPDSQ